MYNNETGVYFIIDASVQFVSPTFTGSEGDSLFMGVVCVLQFYLGLDHVLGPLNLI